MPRYPFTPELLDALPEELCELFRGLEVRLLEEICSRLKIADQLNEVKVQDIRALRAHGIDLEDIKAAIAEATGTGADKLEALLDDVVERNQAYYTSVIDLAQVTAPERLVNEADIAAIRRQTWGAYKNITGSMGFLVVQAGRLTMLPPAQAYQWALDSAELQIQSGAISYTQAIGGAVKQLAERGMCVAYDESGNVLPNRVAYESGHIDHLDVAVRRAVMTGVNQLNQQYREQSMDCLETDLVEVTAHSGARDTDGPNGWENHAAWQGKVYRWSAKPKTSKGVYPDFAKTCGYGSVTGIGGANCSHSWWPFVEGVSERAYTDGDLAAIDPEPFRYEGRTYTAYQATQKQREIERTVRKLERTKTAYTAAGLTGQADAASIRLGRLKKEYRKFSRAAGLKEQRERMRVLDRSGAASRGQSAGSSVAGRPGRPVQIGTVDFSDKRAVLTQMDAAQKETEPLDYEVNRTVTADGKVWRVVGEAGEVHPESIPSSLTGSYSYHNHPAAQTWFSFSAEDVRFFFESRQAYSKASDYLYEYIMERTPDTLAVSPDVVYHRFKEIFKTDVFQLSDEGKINIDEDGFHEVMRRLSREFRFQYRRVKTNGS